MTERDEYHQAVAFDTALWTFMGVLSIFTAIVGIGSFAWLLSKVL